MKFMILGSSSICETFIDYTIATLQKADRDEYRYQYLYLFETDF
jgi:hypothetical protein